MPLDAVIDKGERVLRLLADVTGVRQSTCPWQSMRDPFVGHVMREHRWWAKGAPTAARAQMPRALVDGLETYDGALAMTLAHDARVERERLEREQRERGARGVPGSFSRRRR